MLINVLTAICVVAAVGLFFGVLLALFIRFFGVEEDKRIKEIRASLPGANCGACGFAGCNDYAEALAKGITEANLCIPGGTATTKDLSGILGIEIAAPKDVIAFVHCNGTCDAASDKAIYDGIVSCKASTMICGGQKLCTYGCLGCGDCAKVCPSKAIRIINGVAKVDTTRCVGCGMCASECTKKIISMIPQKTTIAVYCASNDKGADARKACKNACISCKKCEKTCQDQAISVINNCAIIDYTKCNGCGMCADVCPTACLKKVYFPDRSEVITIELCEDEQ